MRCRVKLFSTSPDCLASDGSYIPADVVSGWLNSEAYTKAVNGRTMLVGLTHRRRNLQACSNFTNALKSTVGRDDSALLIDQSGNAPVGYIEKLELMPDTWVYADIAFFDESLADEDAAKCIKRIKYLLKAGVKCGISSVVLGYWESQSGTHTDTLKKLVAIRGADWTLNPSWKEAGATEIYDDDGTRLDEELKTFSLVENSDDEIRVKQFSDINSMADGLAKTSKIDGTFTRLMAKEYSVNSFIEGIEDAATNFLNDIAKEKDFSETEKTFSAATLKERVRFAKYSPRLRMRRLFLDYKTLVKQLGGVEKIDPETLKVLKALFTTDVLDIFKTITPEITAGKQINTLLGASSLGKGIRQASQNLQMPCRLAYQEAAKRGIISPQRYKKLQQAYMDFINAMSEEVFGNNNPIPEGLEKSVEDEESKLK